MNSESGQRLSVEELKRLNQPPTTPVPTTPPSSPMRQDWNDLLAALGALYQLESTNSDRLERLEASVGATGGPAAGDLCPGGEVSHPSPTGGAGAGCGPDPRDIATGWEETRAEFLAAQDFPVEDLLAQSPGLSLAGGPAWNPDSGLPGSGGLDLLLQVGYALESLQGHAPIIGTAPPRPIIPTENSGKEKKRRKSLWDRIPKISRTPNCICERIHEPCQVSRKLMNENIKSRSAMDTDQTAGKSAWLRPYVCRSRFPSGGLHSM